MPRKDLSLAEKIDLLNKVKKSDSKQTCRELEILTGVSKSTISRLKCNESILRHEWESKLKRYIPKRQRDGKDPVIEEALNEWFKQIRAKGLMVNGSMLKTKAEEIAERIGHTNFKATEGWFSRWKCRHEIKFKRAHGEKNSANLLAAEEWRSLKLNDLLKKYNPEDVYNADETGLFYRATPDGSLCYKRHKLIGCKKAMDRFTVLCCCNMTGTDKRKLLVIGKHQKPRCFKGINMDLLPVNYFFNKNSWMTTTIFMKWLQSWEKELQIASRKILLIVDNATVHCNPEFLKNIHIEFLPPNSTSILQPLDMGIIRNLKMLYRNELTKHVLESVERSIYSKTTNAQEISSKISILQAIQLVAKSWKEISSSTIQNCFSHCGMKVPNLISVVSNNNLDSNCYELENIDNFEEFINIDEHLVCYDDNEDLMETILEQIKPLSEQEEENDDETDLCVDYISDKEAKRCISILKKYFMQIGNENSPMSALDSCADFVAVKSIKKLRQGTLDNFLK